MLALLPGLARQEPAGFDELWRQVRWLSRSYWGVFGYGVLAQPFYYRFVEWMMGAAAVGWLIGAVRLFFQRGRCVDHRHVVSVAVLSALWFVVVFVALLQWMRMMQFTDQGRLLFPAATAISLLLVLGWRAWFPSRLTVLFYALTPLMFVGMAASQISTLVENYSMPTELEPPISFDRDINAHFANGVTLQGIDLPQGASIDANGELPVVLYWTSMAPIEDFYTVFLHLADSNNQLLYQYDGIPWYGRHPTRQWVPNTVFADPYVVQIGETDDSLATLSVGLYRYDIPGQREVITDEAGKVLGDRVVLAPVRTHSMPRRSIATEGIHLATWKGGIGLVDATTEYTQEGTPTSVSLLWTSSAVVHKAYTVFLQVLDENDQIIAQVDRQPQFGAYPTSTWKPGDLISDRYELQIPPSTAWYRIIIGLYDDSGVRLHLTEEPSADYLEIANSQGN